MTGRTIRAAQLPLAALTVLFAVAAAPARLEAASTASTGIPGRILEPEGVIDCATGFPPANGGHDLAAELAAVLSQVPQATARCARQTIDCAGDGIQNHDFFSAVIWLPHPSGTILSFSGARGAGFHSENVAEYVEGRFRVALIAYAMSSMRDTWACPLSNCPDYLTAGDPGPRAAGCRPATVIAYFKNQFQMGAFCAQGHSAGSSQLAYAMSHYNLGEAFDYVQLTGWTPFAKPGCGCDPSNWPSTCPDEGNDGMREYAENPPEFQIEAIDRPFYYAAMPGAGGQNFLTLVGDAFGLHSGDECRALNAAPISQAAFARLSSNGIVSSGADYYYGATVMDLYACADQKSVVDGNGSWYLEKIAGANPGHIFVETIPWVAEDPDCSLEDVWNDPDGGPSPLRQKTIDRMLGQCVDHGDAGWLVDDNGLARLQGDGN